MLAGKNLVSVQALIDQGLAAYWKSVEWPGQGVFIGEPLAAPFRG